MRLKSVTRIKSAMTLAGIALIVFIVCTYRLSDHSNDLNEGSTKAEMTRLALLLENFRNTCGSYPTTQQGLQSLVSKPSDLNCKAYPPEGFAPQSFQSHFPQDAWAKPFTYVSDGKTYRIDASHGISKSGP